MSVLDSTGTAKKARVIVHLLRSTYVPVRPVLGTNWAAQKGLWSRVSPITYTFCTIVRYCSSSKYVMVVSAHGLTPAAAVAPIAWLSLLAVL